MPGNYRSGLGDDGLPLSGLIQMQPFPDETFLPQHKPRGSRCMDATWSDRTWPKALRKELGLAEPPRPVSASQKTGGRTRAQDPFGSPEARKRPASAANVDRQGRPLSAAPNRSRPSTAPSDGRARNEGIPRPTSGKALKNYDRQKPENLGGGRGLTYVTKSAKELRDEFINHRRKENALNPAFLKTKSGDDAGGLRLTPMGSEASTCDGEEYLGDSDDSDLDDEERLERAFRKIARLEETTVAAVEQAEKLKLENEAHLAEIERLSETIEAYEEKVDLLTAAEDRWREKNSELRIQDATHRLNLDRARMNRSDLEDRTRPLDLEMSRCRKTIRRWNMAFNRVGDLLDKRRSVEELACLWQAWRMEMETAKAHSSWEKRVENLGVADFSGQIRGLEQRIEELEGELQGMAVLKEQIMEAHVEIGRLRTVQVHVGAQIVFAWFHGFGPDRSVLKNAFAAWSSVIPKIKSEREYAELLQAHEQLALHYKSIRDQLLVLHRELEEDVRLVEAKRQLAVVLERQGTLQADLDITLQRSCTRQETIQTLRSVQDIESKAAKELLRVTQETLKAEIEDLDEAWTKRYTDSEEENASAQARLNADCEELEARVDDLLEALNPDGASGEGRATRISRVVPRAQGVLCAGCMTQILYRDVRPVMSVGELDRATPQRLERERAALFEKTLGGPDTHDPAHVFLWQQRKDPSGAIPAVNLQADSRPRSALQPLRSLPPDRPQSATSLGAGKRTRALRGEVAGFRKLWKG